MAHTILVVDDDLVQRQLFRATIMRHGLSVALVPGGRSALDILFSPEGESVSLMLLDLIMPDIDGIEVLTRLRAVNKKLPVIIVTAKDGLETAVEAIRAGANDFLTKPVSPERLMASIQDALKPEIVSTATA